MGPARKTPNKTKKPVKSVKVRLVNVKKDDCEPTPTCNMEFKTDKGHVFSKEVLPDTGCSQTIISESLAKTNKMFVDLKKTKQIWNASNEQCRAKAPLPLRSVMEVKQPKFRP